ncbi:hypothetical protein SAMN04487968_101497 [Nocardioides terrae]|uniref:Uncharacterized protein n=1 Tax=Nocardioides terrae TaxID=574651 RepID=A0A1I1DZC9_9ACTN|nr:hypothetical protein SAMN04487968_101497 [Nocardioides terrae]
MPASLNRIREHMRLDRTARDKGWKLTVTVTAYDNGMIQVDGIPINDSDSGYDEAEGWLGAAENVALVLNEFRRQVKAAR